MANREERSKQGSIEDRKLFSFRDVAKFLMYMISLIIAVAGYSKVSGMLNPTSNQSPLMRNDGQTSYHLVNNGKHFADQDEKDEVFDHIIDKTIHFSDEEEKDKFKFALRDINEMKKKIDAMYDYIMEKQKKP